ncbi:SNF2 family N-terminal domain-containing protein [Rhodocollybia butyracea]|uniref:SNF2 family N-terminal domain-containing protein n=1 Tax=Rhodocollybia butyracea TaxID=206335 RepID=A0A9P5Q841_9AGAR|nr:SNF2 family N-terminal domain-containing protein [Rhodocollybia butyracea]
MASHHQEEAEIQAVLNHTRKEGRENDPEDVWFDNTRFHIKWKNFFAPPQHRRNLRGYKIWQSRVNAPNLSQEDKEVLLLDKEREKEDLKTFKTVVLWLIAKQRTQTKDVNPIAKEQNVNPIAKEQIEAYRTREAEGRFPYKSPVYPRHARPAFHKITEDPDYIVQTGCELKDFQLTGVNWLAYLWGKGENGILADERGLGKTVQSIAFISFLFHEMHQYGPFLVIVPLSTITAWQAQFSPPTYIGSAAAREVIRMYEFGPSSKNIKMNVLLTTYEPVVRDAKELGDIKWQVLAVDETHSLKNSESPLYEALVSFNASSKLLILGSPLQNNVKELLSLMHFLMPEKCKSPSNAVEKGGWLSVNVLVSLTDEFDSNDIDHEEKIRQLHEQIESLMLRRLKRDVLKSLPATSERILRVEMSALQTHFYKNILTKNFQALVKTMELKKVANHPYLFDGAEPTAENNEEILKGLVTNSGKIVLLDKLLVRLKEGGHRVLIFSQMVRMLDILSGYMSFRGYPHQRLDGTVASDARKTSVLHFNALNSPDFAFLLSTRVAGFGISLERVHTVIIFDSDWSLQNDLQAMARVHWIDQNPVDVYRIVSKDTMEEAVLDLVKNKMVVEYAILHQMDTSQNLSSIIRDFRTNGNISKAELTAVLKYGTQKIFDKEDSQRNQNLDELDLDAILEYAKETIAVGGDWGTSLGGEGSFAQFTAISDVMNWKDIIPLNENQQFETDKDQRTVEELAAEGSS